MIRSQEKVCVLSHWGAFAMHGATRDESLTVTIASDIADELRGPMESTDPKDVNEQVLKSERVLPPETMFGYARSTEVGDATDDGDEEVVTLE
jgi:hypothetical protein